jgi:general stress protein 26
MELKDKILEVVGGVNISALATVQSDSHPVPRVRYLTTVGFPDLSMKTATHRSSIKTSHIKNNPKGCITTWNGKNEFWNPMLGNFFSGPDDPEYVILNLKPYSIEYYSDGKMEKLTSI